MPDPTYVIAEIEAKPVWELAYSLSEIQNDMAPIGWGKYIWLAEGLLANYNIERKSKVVTNAT